MADAGSKGDTPDKATAKLADDTIEAVIADAGIDKGEDDAAPSEPVDAKKSKLGLFIIILLFLISASLGGLKLTGQLQPMYESLQAQLGLFATDQAKSAVSPAALPHANPSHANQTHPKALSSSREQLQQESMPAQPSVPAVKTVQPVITPTQTMTPEAGGTPAVTSAEVSRLLAVIDQLRTEMQQLEASQQTLHDGLLEQQQMNTQVRLRWIADPASRLPQMQLAWEEISLLPGLTVKQRELAVEMHALARTNVQLLRQWKGSLQKWAEVLVTPAHADILPQPQQPWLAWLVGQFQLRQAPSAEARRLADLRTRLLDAGRQLSLESWPSQGTWQSLHAELLLQIKAMQGDGTDAASATIDTGLPLDFSAIQHDITVLRQTARQWSVDDQLIDEQLIDHQQGDVL